MLSSNISSDATNPPPSMSEEQIAFAFELNKQGMSYKMIERKTGVGIATQKRKFKNYKNIL